MFTKSDMHFGEWLQFLHYGFDGLDADALYRMIGPRMRFKDWIDDLESTYEMDETLVERTYDEDGNLKNLHIYTPMAKRIFLDSESKTAEMYTEWCEDQGIWESEYNEWDPDWEPEEYDEDDWDDEDEDWDDEEDDDYE